MDKKSTITDLIPAQGILPLYFDADAAVSIAVLKALYEGGIRAVEYTNRGAAALKNFSLMRAVCDKELPGMYLGIGTIKSVKAAQEFIDAGADFLISPGMVEGVNEIAKAFHMLWIPGCMTPTEIIQAEAEDIHVIKLFPGNLLGPSFVQAIKPLFPKLQFLVTGGVDATESNIRSWLQAGVAGVGMGSKMISEKVLQEKNYANITLQAQQLLQIIQSIRK